jgi:hypothetical protein
MPPLTTVLPRLGTMSPCNSECIQPMIWSRNITDSAGLSSQAKIGLISAGAVAFVLVVLILPWFLVRRVVGRNSRLSKRLVLEWNVSMPAGKFAAPMITSV